MTFLGIACALATLAGCGGVRETLPERSALEQVLISSAADRAIRSLAGKEFSGKTVFTDVSNLDCYDKPYVVQRIKEEILLCGGTLAQDRKDAQVVLEVASGALSIDKRSYLLGIPEIPIPVPAAGASMRIPEIPIFKSLTYTGKAKLLFSVIDPTTNRQVVAMPVCSGKSSYTFWWCLIMGPFEQSDVVE